MRCVVINLPSRPDRREAMDRQFQRVGLSYELWPAVAAEHLTPDQRAAVDHDARVSLGMRPLGASELACLLSHTDVLRDVAGGTDDTVAVFEDDALLDQDLPRFFAALDGKADKFDVIMLERRNRSIPYHPLYEVSTARTIGRLQFSDFGACGYVITRRAAEHMLQRFPSPTHEIDRILPRFWMNGLSGVFWVDPPLVRHNAASPSEIQPARRHGRVDHRARMRGSPLLVLRRFMAMAGQSLARRRRWSQLRRQDRGVDSASF